jgi:hypothetical protein
MPDSGEKPGNFTVRDRRAFDASGERKEDVQEEPVKPTSTEPAKVEPARNLPPADFGMLVLSLGSSVVMYLGETPEGPNDKKATRNLPMAKHAIDLLTVLEEKTRGNLSAEEEHILGSLLFDLRLRYVEALKTSPSGGG